MAILDRWLRLQLPAKSFDDAGSEACGLTLRRQADAVVGYL